MRAVLRKMVDFIYRPEIVGRRDVLMQGGAIGAIGYGCSRLSVLGLLSLSACRSAEEREINSLLEGLSGLSASEQVSRLNHLSGLAVREDVASAAKAPMIEPALALIDSPDISVRTAALRLLRDLMGTNLETDKKEQIVGTIMTEDHFSFMTEVLADAVILTDIADSLKDEAIQFLLNHSLARPSARKAVDSLTKILESSISEIKKEYIVDYFTNQLVEPEVTPERRFYATLALNQFAASEAISVSLKLRMRGPLTDALLENKQNRVGVFCVYALAKLVRSAIVLTVHQEEELVPVFLMTLRTGSDDVKIASAFALKELVLSAISLTHKTSMIRPLCNALRLSGWELQVHVLDALIEIIRIEEISIDLKSPIIRPVFSLLIRNSLLPPIGVSLAIAVDLLARIDFSRPEREEMVIPLARALGDDRNVCDRKFHLVRALRYLAATDITLFYKARMVEPLIEEHFCRDNVNGSIDEGVQRESWLALRNISESAGISTASNIGLAPSININALQDWARATLGQATPTQ